MAERRPRRGQARDAASGGKSGAAPRAARTRKAPAERTRKAGGAKAHRGGSTSRQDSGKGSGSTGKASGSTGKATGTRKTTGPRKPTGIRTGTGRTAHAAPGRRSRGPKPAAVRDEILRLGGTRGQRFYEQLVKAADAYSADRERDALRTLKPLRDALPQVASVRELAGLSLYRSGRYAEAAEELEEYVRLCGAVDQHPALMDCYRALRKWKRIDLLWAELTATSAAPEVMTEGRIVRAGSLADRGRLREAIQLLEKRAGGAKTVADHHLRLWYALADLQDRAGNLPRARTLFERVSREDPGFADVAERLAALG